MGFYRRAYYSAADQYGRDRSVKYGRVARFFLVLKVAGIVGLTLAIVFIVATHHQ